MLVCTTASLSGAEQASAPAPPVREQILDRLGRFDKDIHVSLGDLGRRADDAAVELLLKLLDDPGHRPEAVEALGHVPGRAKLDEVISRHLDVERFDVKTVSSAVQAAGFRKRADSTPKLGPLLRHPDMTLVRVTVVAIGRCGGDAATPLLIDLYRNGETHDRWGFHVKQDILRSLARLKSPKALPLAFAALAHANASVAHCATHVVVAAGKDDPEAGKQLLLRAEVELTQDRLRSLIVALGRLRYAPSARFIAEAHSAGRVKDYPAAMALAEIATADCAETLMTIYLKQPPLRDQRCLTGEPILPCLQGLKAISGADFGDDREKWMAWYSTFLAMRVY